MAAATGEAALITYNDEITAEKPFGHGDLQPALKALSFSGYKANMVDAGMREIELLKEHRQFRRNIVEDMRSVPKSSQHHDWWSGSTPIEHFKFDVLLHGDQLSSMRRQVTRILRLDYAAGKNDERE